MQQTDYRETRFNPNDNTVVPDAAMDGNEDVNLPGGSFTMGTNDSPFPADGEGPERHVTLRPFSIDKYEVGGLLEWTLKLFLVPREMLMEE